MVVVMMVMMMKVVTVVVMVMVVCARGAGASGGDAGTARPEGVTRGGVTRGGVTRAEGVTGGGVTGPVTAARRVRLVGAGEPCEGLVQMRHGQRWDALCVSGWNASGRLAEELCQGAGCGPPKRDAGSLSPQLYGGDLLYPSVRCLGEFVSRCTACPVLRCSWESTATLACEPGPATTTDEVAWPRVRVLGGWGPCQGHLEALHAGSWRGVCAQALDASLTCAQLQCPTDEVKVTEREIDPAGLDLDPYRWVAQAPCTGERGERGEQAEQATHKCRDLLTWSDVSTCPGNRSAFISCRERSGPMLVVSWLIVSTAIVSLLALLALRLVEWRPGLLSSVKGGLSATRDRLCLSRSWPRDRYSHPNPARWRGSLDYEAPGGAHSEAHGGAHSGAHGGAHSEAHGKAQWEAHGAAESGPQGGAHSGTHGGAHSGAHGGAHSEAHGKAQWEAHSAAERGSQGGAHGGVPGGAAPGGGTPAGTPSRVDRYSVTPVEEKERLDSGSSMLCDLAELNGLLSTHGYRLDSSLTPPPGYLQALRTLTRPHPPGLTPPPSYLQALRILSRPMLVPLATHDPDQRQDEEEEEEAEGGNDEGQGLLARPVIVHSAQPGRESLL